MPQLLNINILTQGPNDFNYFNDIPLFFGSGQIPQSMAGVGTMALKTFIRMRKVEIGEKLKTLLNQRLRIHPSRLKWFFSIFEGPGTDFLGARHWADWRVFVDSVNFCNFYQGIWRIESSEPARMESWGVLLSKMKKFGAFRSRPSLGESPKPWIFFIFMEIPLKTNEFQWPRAIRMKKKSTFRSIVCTEFW